MSIADISLPSTFDSSLAAELTEVTRIAAITSDPDSDTSGNSRETPQKAHTPEDDSGAKSSPNFLVENGQGKGSLINTSA